MHGTPDLKHQLDQWQAIVEASLDRHARALPGVPERLTRAIRHGLFGRAKRVRALMLLALGADLGIELEQLMSPACAIEMVHAASLVLDDLPCMDDARCRRGQMATHRAFGEATAIIATMALIARAYEVIAADPSIACDARTRMMEKVAISMGAQGLCGGQLDDLRRTAGSDVERLLSIYSRKTSALFSLSLELPLLVAAVDVKRQHASAEAGRRIGIAFQIYDDMVDAFATHAAAGKDVRKDAAKITIPKLLGATAALQRADLEMSVAIAEIEAIAGNGRTAALLRLLASGARLRIGLVDVP